MDVFQGELLLHRIWYVHNWWPERASFILTRRTTFKETMVLFSPRSPPDSPLNYLVVAVFSWWGSWNFEVFFWNNCFPILKTWNQCCFLFCVFLSSCLFWFPLPPFHTSPLPLCSMQLGFNAFFFSLSPQVAIKIIDKTQLNPNSLQKVIYPPSLSSVVLSRCGRVRL